MIFAAYRSCISLSFKDRSVAPCTQLSRSLSRSVGKSTCFDCRGHEFSPLHFRSSIKNQNCQRQLHTCQAFYQYQTSENSHWKLGKVFCVSKYKLYTSECKRKKAKFLILSHCISIYVNDLLGTEPISYNKNSQYFWTATETVGRKI